MQPPRCARGFQLEWPMHFSYGVGLNMYRKTDVACVYHFISNIFCNSILIKHN